jgi:hypothetical protein
MAYVDLNPISAKMGSRLDESKYTSVFERTQGKSSHQDNPKKLLFTVKPLLGFIGNELKTNPLVSLIHCSIMLT